MTVKKHNLTGCCGISCGPDAHCPYCSIFRCCSMKRGYETCEDCGEFPCGKCYKWFDSDSFVTHRNCYPNIERMKNDGDENHFSELKERKTLLEKMLNEYNPGRCTSLYCQASSLLSIETLKEAIRQIRQAEINEGKTTVSSEIHIEKLFKALILELAGKEGIRLKLRK